MSYKIILLFFTAMKIHASAAAQQLSGFDAVKAMEQQLEDVMEITDTGVLKTGLPAVESACQQHPTTLNKARLGIIYHEVALNLSFLSATNYKGYAAKSYSLLDELYNSSSTSPALMPFLASYRASALSLKGAETRKLKLIGKAFRQFDDAVRKYAAVSYLPEFLRGSVAENLPWFFFSKRKYAKTDFSSIIERQAAQPGYATAKIMSFTYWAWANQHQSKRYRAMALNFLDKAIQLDPKNEAGRAKAEALKQTLAH